jgi:CRISPR system Cascade subunit CasB
LGRAHYTVAALIAARPRTARDADRAAAAEALVPDTGAEADTKPDTNPDALASPEDSTGASRPKPVDWWTRPNLGASLGEAVNKRLLKADTAEADLHLMVRQGADALQQRLPALTRHLLGGGVRIDWSVLLDDLALWDLDRDRIATRWLESYFHVRDRDDTDDPGSHDASADTPTDPPAPRKENC